MKIRIITGLLSLLISVSLSADIVDKEKAKVVAESFLMERILSGEIHSWDVERLNLTDVYTFSENDLPLYYVFSNNGAGFIIVAADNYLVPVIGYSSESTFPIPGENLNFDSYMQSVAEQVKFVRNNLEDAPAGIENLWQHYLQHGQQAVKTNLEAVPALCSVLWNQDFPYNIMCPPDPAGSGGYAYAGCVATAMSMVMYHYRYPLHGTGSHTYYATGYGAQTADFENTYYRWDEMLNAVSTSDGESILPVAELQYHAGVAIDMGYSPSGSGASVEAAKNALKLNFGYSNTIQHLNRTSFTAESWEAMIVKQLDSLMPVIYSGQSSAGGHAFLCDGYQETGNGKYFHFNFGWGGSANGYYTLANPAGFGSGQSVIRNIHPKSDYPYYCSDRVITGTSGSFEDGSGPRMNYRENTSCSWLIAPADSVTKLHLMFTDFHIDASDTLFIFDGPKADAPMLGAFNGDTLPPALTSTGNRLFLKLISDNQNTSKGFQAVYNSDFPLFCNTNTTDTASSGIITDGSGLYRYNNGTYCRWKIMPPNASSVGITFTEFDLDKKDQVMVFSLGTTSTLLETFTGDMKPYTIISPTGALMLYFKSDFCGKGEGFTAEYSISIGKDEETPFLNLLDIYPNPAREQARIRFNSMITGELQVSLTNPAGQILLTEKHAINHGINNILMDVSRLKPGMYFINLQNGQGIESRKLIVSY